MTKRTLRLSAPRDPAAATSTSKAGVRMVRARTRRGESPAAPVPAAPRKPREGGGKPRREDGGPRRDAAAGTSRRTDGPGRRDGAPRTRSEDGRPRRDQDARPRRGDDRAPRREDSRQGRSDDRPPRRDGPPRTRSEDGRPRREQDGRPRRGDDRAPRREDSRQGRSDNRPPRRDGEQRPPRPEGAHPRREGARGDTGAARPWGAPASSPAPARPRTAPAGSRGGRASPPPDAGSGLRRRRERIADVAPPQRPPEPPSRPEGGLVRVSKLLSERGLCSRREADEYIEKGWVWADGERVTQLGARVAPTAELRLDRGARAVRARLATILLHKPVGYVSGQPEDDHPPAMALIRPENLWDASPPSPGSDAARFDPAHLRGLAPAGRLDIESTGLLVFTQDGTVARQLVGADSAVGKEYLVRVEGEMIEGGLDLLNHGLELDGQPLRPARVEWLNDDQLRFVLHEGRKRQIRRMCELVGLRVTGLKRVRIGGAVLGDLPVGRWRYLGAEETF